MLICFQIGYFLVYYGLGDFGQFIYLDEVVCDGDEKFLLECNLNIWGIYNCNYQEDVSVLCYNVIGKFREYNYYDCVI